MDNWLVLFTLVGSIIALLFVMATAARYCASRKGRIR